MTQSLRKVDQNGLKTGMAITIVLLIAAFILNSPLLVAIVAVCQLIGAAALPFAPYKLIYDYAVKPAGIVRPKVITDNPEPHRFAMLVGGIFNLAGVLLLLAGMTAAGWVPVWIVIALANLNFWLNFCAGCWMYYQFNRLGVPGFTVSPIKE